MRELLPLLPKPGRYLGSEWGAVKKDPARVEVHAALAFPDLYEVGMSYLGQKILYQAVNARPEAYAERVYAPCEETAAIMRERGAPLCTLETDTPLARTHAVAFSLTHELCYTNVLYMLDLAGIPLAAADRDESHPLILAGGGACFNIEPMAEFLDLAVIGDGEHTLPLILERLARARRESVPRRRLLLELCGLPGVYVPGLYRETGPGLALEPIGPAPARVEKALAEDLDPALFPTDQPLPFGRAVHDRLTLEIARGCTRGCRFCQAGMIYRPVRERGPETLERLLDQGLRRTGFEETSFLSLSSGDYSALETLFERSFERCAASQVAMSLPSLRVGSLSEPIMKRMASIRRTGATIAPEAGSQRLRDVINKGIGEPEILEHVRLLFANGWQMVKLYFMIGLPTETDEDIKAILDLCLKVRDAAGPRVKRLQVTAAVSPFVPKPHTPFQWEAQIGLEQIRERIGRLQGLFHGQRRLKLKFHQPEMSFLEGILARGDRRLGKALLRAYELGAVFSSWTDRLRLGPYLEALAANGLRAEDFLAARDPDSPLAWEHLDCGVSKAFLLAERQRAGQGRITPDCRYDKCQGCGVCNHEGRASNLTGQARAKDIRPRLVFERRDQATGPERGPAERGAAERGPAEPPDLDAKAGHYRLWYRKLGPAAYLSQLDLQGQFERALRRSGLALSFSKGFHPMPRLSFGLALPVGVESLCEWFNIYLRQDLDAQEVLGALDGLLPEGLEVFRAEGLGPGRRQPQARQEVFRVVFNGPAEVIEARRGQWARFWAADHYQLTRQTKRGMKLADVRPLAVGVFLDEPGGVRLVLDWGLGYVNPLELVRKVNGPLTGLEFSMTKLEQIFQGPEAAALSPRP
ncbi:MAG: TIGR03960 family B12-binding radical SAM protein [Desulfovibrionaceae bacterium]|nr:TIGR03960 family B12-binding radical SAM protein [Desulfovibrionaceae bacterium]